MEKKQLQTACLLFLGFVERSQIRGQRAICQVSLHAFDLSSTQNQKTTTFTKPWCFQALSAATWHILAYLGTSWNAVGFHSFFSISCPACAVLINLAKATTSLSCQHERNNTWLQKIRF
jgi:hypothetical protein